MIQRPAFGLLRSLKPLQSVTAAQPAFLLGMATKATPG